MLIVATFVLAQAAASTGANVLCLSRDQLGAALQSAQGRQPGVEIAELTKQAGYSVLEIRRTAPGGSEVHADWADVWYVQRGNATLVTGGTVVDGVTAEPGEIRGKGVAGGAQRELKAGDVVVIPAGVPHWISGVRDEFVYLVVKAPGRRPAEK